MKNIILKNWAFIGWLFAVLLDKSTGFVEQVVPNPFWQNFIYVVGAGVLGYFWTSKYNEDVVKKSFHR